MSSSSPLQCLFCNHLNPGGATFCNDCGSQLQLQQCDLCGSINKRSAKICYKCGAPFVALAAHGGHSAIEGGQAGSVVWQERSDQATLHESAAQAFSARCRESPDSGLAVPAGGDCGKVAASPRQELVQDLAQPIDLALSPEAAASTGFRYLYTIACLVLVLALVFLSIYYYRGRSSAQVTAPNDEQTAGAPSNDRSSPGAASAAQSPLPAGADVVRESPVDKSCQEAVVALGLCGELAKQEKP